MTRATYTHSSFRLSIKAAAEAAHFHILWKVIMGCSQSIKCNSWLLERNHAHMHNTLTWCTHKQWSTYSSATTRIKITRFLYIRNSWCSTPSRPAKHKTVTFTPDLTAVGCYMHLFTNLLTVFHSTVSSNLSMVSGFAHFCSHWIPLQMFNQPQFTCQVPGIHRHMSCDGPILILPHF